MESNNRLIADRFYMNKGWKTLQNIDSGICSKVISFMTGAGIPCLPWHDSWVCAEKHRKILLYVMRKAWVNTFGTEMNFNCKVEF